MGFLDSENKMLGAYVTTPHMYMHSVGWIKMAFSMIAVFYSLRHMQIISAQLCAWNVETTSRTFSTLATAQLEVARLFKMFTEPGNVNAEC
jgi:hypothetical protein